MSVPYTSGDFSQARVVDHWVEYPLSGQGDTTTKLRKLRCRVNVANYSASMSLLGAPAGMTSGQFCGDSPAQSISGGVLEFVRTFADIPRSRTEYSTATFTFPPEFGTKIEPTMYTSLPQTTGLTLSIGGSLSYRATKTRKFEYVKTPAETRVIPVRVEYSYTTSPASVAIKTEESYSLIKGDASTYETYYLGNSVIETNEGTTTVVKTGDNGVVIGTQVNRWMGNIYEVATGYKV